MKFRKIRLHNFMRYKGDNELKFSCDTEKNVTIVLGDNTFGKTTIAQAFRWGLYGSLKKTNYVKKIDDIVLLNKEMIASMREGDKEKVEVEIVVEDGGTTYTFIRSQEFRKIGGENGNVTAYDKIPKLIMTENNGDIIDNLGSKNSRPGHVQNTINTMFPENLSDYLFFDGERWGANENKSVDIQNSINNIIGLTSLVKMTEHLKNGNQEITNRATVISKLNRKISSLAGEDEKVHKEIELAQKRIEYNKNEIEQKSKDIEGFEHSIEKLEKILNDNASMENDKKQLDIISRNRNVELSHKKNYYNDIIKTFSKTDKKLVAALLPRINGIIEQVDVEGKDIPGVTAETIDWLLENKICLCGEKLKEGESHYETIKKLREEVYPNKIGGPIKIFKEHLLNLEYDTRDLVVELKEKCEKYEICIQNIEEIEENIHALEYKIDKRLNLEETRRQFNYFNNQKREHESLIRKREEENRDLERKLESYTEQLKEIAKKNKENEGILRAIKYANSIYEKANWNIEIRQKNMFEELNEIIKVNFVKMFNSKEKYAALGQDFKMHMYYKNGVEEKNLSEGEITAVNFVYIVSILELAKRQREKEEDKNSVLSLPLVLDAPFSKLGTQNIELISRRLPEFAEQVIIFMLDKDWKASGLEMNTLSEYCYRVDREYSDISSTIITNGGNE